MAAIENILVVGNSHSFALKKGLNKQNATPVLKLHYKFVQLNEESFKPVVYEDQSGNLKLNANLMQAITRSSPDIIASIVGGNHHVAVGLTRPPSKLDFILPEAPELPLDPEAEFIPYSVIAEWFSFRSRETRKVIAALKQDTGLPVIQLELPPPIGDETYLRVNGGQFAPVIADRGISPLSFRYKTWRANCDVSIKTCKALQIPYLPVPPSTLDDGGMLRREFWGEDPTHANGSYGLAYLAALEEYLSTAFPVES